jgi:hypothetical protein
MLFDLDAPACRALLGLRALRLVFATLALVAVAAPACAPVTVAPFAAEQDGGIFGDAPTGSSGGSSGSSSGGAADAGMCLPGDVQTFHPTYHPAAVEEGACASPSGADLISAFFEACFGENKSDDACRTFGANNPTCAACIVTPDSAKSYGPIIDHGGFVTANVAGCIEVEVANEGPSDEAGAPESCATAVDALQSCVLAACEANCPVSDQTSLNAYQTCATVAAAGGCGAFDSAADCALPSAEAGVPAVCIQTDFGAFYNSVVPLFCLSPQPMDAGSPPPEAGAGYDAGGAAKDGGAASDAASGGD